MNNFSSLFYHFIEIISFSLLFATVFVIIVEIVEGIRRKKKFHADDLTGAFLNSLIKDEDKKI